MMVLRIYFQQLGGHVHCRVFSGPAPDRTLGKNGDLVFNEQEWPEFVASMTRLSYRPGACMQIEFLEEGGTRGGTRG